MDLIEKKECDRCGSTNTYFTKTKKFCRACGYESIRKDVIQKLKEGREVEEEE